MRSDCGAAAEAALRLRDGLALHRLLNRAVELLESLHGEGQKAAVDLLGLLSLY